MKGIDYSYYYIITKKNKYHPYATDEKGLKAEKC